MINEIIIFVGGLIAGVIAFYVAERRIQIENVTQLRDTWRSDIRAKTIQLHQAIMTRNEEKIKELHTEFTVLLNPLDINDREILDKIKMADQGEEYDACNEISKRISLLLKHDWQRAKLETKWYGFLFPEPKRVLLNELNQDRDNENQNEDGGQQSLVLIIILLIVLLSIIEILVFTQ